MKHLLQHFKTLTKHPKNAEELKGLILQLAIQGKLTENWREENPNVESASVLFKKIEIERKQLIKEKRIKNSKRLPIVDDEEKYFKIPDTWEWERLGNIGNIFNGNSVNKSVKQAKYEGLEEGYPYIGTKDVGYLYDSINEDNGVRIPFNEPKFKVARKNTVLICSEGGSAGKKMGILEQDCCFGNKLYAVEQYGQIESLYILSLYGSLSFSDAFKTNMTGIIGGISRSNFAHLIIPLPPLEEQKAIVAIVNELFQEVEQLEEQTKTRIELKEDFVTSALQRLTQTENVNQEWQYLQPHFTEFFTEKENVKQLRATILQLGVQAKLTHNWRTMNPYTEEVDIVALEASRERFQREAASTKGQKTFKYKSSAKIDVGGKSKGVDSLFNIPKSWQWVSLGQLSWSINDGPHFSPKYVDDGIPMISGRNVTYVKGIDFSSAKFVSQEDHVEFTKRGKPEVGDVLLTKGGTTGVPCVVETSREFSVWVHVALIKVIPQFVNPHYLKMALASPFVYQQSQAQTHGIGNKDLGLTRMIFFAIPLPPKEEQKAIVNQVNSLMTLCDSLEEHIQNSQTQIEQLMQSCLREVFEEKDE